MKIKLQNTVFQTITDVISEQKLKAFVIGGYVRDLILERPSKDIDIVVLGSGIKLAKKVANKLDNNINVTFFKNFGTAMFNYNNTEYEFVGARKESYMRNSRKPIVEDGTLEDDQNRRDFTINALAISLNKNNLYEVIDPFTGLQDIKDKVIRTPLNPDITFSDDPLRMLRAIRFATQLNFTIFKPTFEAIIKNKNRINIISKERIIEELNKIILTQKPSIGFKLLFNTGLLEIIFPELYNMHGVEVINKVFHKDVFLHTLQVLDNIVLKTDNLWLRWAAIFHDIGKPKSKRFINNSWTFRAHNTIGEKMLPHIFKKMKLPLNEKMKYVKKLVSLHMRPIFLNQDDVTDSAIRRLLFEAGDDIDDLMLLAEADLTTKIPEKKERFLKNFKLVRQKLKEVEERDAIRNWQPPVDGNEIMKTLNLPPSKLIGEIKDAIKNAILDGKIKNTHEAAKKYMFEMAKKLGV